MKGTIKCMCILFGMLVLFLLCKTIKENLLPYDPKIDDLKRRLLLVHSKASSLQFYHDKKSYTINKQKIREKPYLCDMPLHDLEDLHLLIYGSVARARVRESKKETRGENMRRER